MIQLVFLKWSSKQVTLWVFFWALWTSHLAQAPHELLFLKRYLSCSVLRGSMLSNLLVFPSVSDWPWAVPIAPTPTWLQLLWNLLTHPIHVHHFQTKIMHLSWCPISTQISHMSKAELSIFFRKAASPVVFYIVVKSSLFLWATKQDTRSRTSFCHSLTSTSNQPPSPKHLWNPSLFFFAVTTFSFQSHIIFLR